MGWRKRDFLYAIGALGAIKFGAEMVGDSQINPSNGDDIQSTPTPTRSATTPSSTLESVDPPRVDMSVMHRASRPNQIEFESSIEITDGIQSLSLGTLEQARQIESQGLNKRTNANSGQMDEEKENIYYEWDGESPDCQFRFMLDVTDSLSDTFDGRNFAGTDDWIFAPAPGFSISWSGDRTESVELPETMYPLANRTAEYIQIDVNKPAKFGEEFIYIGEFEERSRNLGDQSITVIIPTHADSVHPEDVFRTLEFASDYLQVGEVTDKIVAFVTTDPIRRGGVHVPQNPFRSLETSVSEFWFHESSSLNSANNTLIHEYVHTRQNLNLDEEMEWFREASAEYYTARIMYNFGSGVIITKSDVTRHLFPGPTYADETLAQKSEWVNPRVPYRKGGYILLALDELIRSKSNNSSTLQQVFYQMNSSEKFFYPQFVDSVSESAGVALDDWCERYIRGSESPSVPEGWEKEDPLDELRTSTPDE